MFHHAAEPCLALGRGYGRVDLRGTASQVPFGRSGRTTVEHFDDLPLQSVQLVGAVLQLVPHLLAPDAVEPLSPSPSFPLTLLVAPFAPVIPLHLLALLRPIIQQPLLQHLPEELLGMRPCLRTRPCRYVLLDLVPVLAEPQQPLQEPLVLVVSPLAVVEVALVLRRQLVGTVLPFECHLLLRLVHTPHLMVLLPFALIPVFPLPCVQHRLSQHFQTRFIRVPPAREDLLAVMPHCHYWVARGRAKICTFQERMGLSQHAKGLGLRFTHRLQVDELAQGTDRLALDQVQGSYSLERTGVRSAIDFLICAVADQGVLRPVVRTFNLLRPFLKCALV